MSIAPRETKCLSSCHWRSGHSRLGHLLKTPSSGLTIGVSQNGQRSGGRSGGERSGRSTAWVAGTQDDHLVAAADVLAREVLLVVQRGELDRHAADVHGLQLRERVQVAKF